MTRPRPIDEHAQNMRALAAGAGRLVDRPTRQTWCPVHPATPASPHCASCAGDHAAGEHLSLTPVPSCLHCRPTPAKITTHTTRSTR